MPTLHKVARCPFCGKKARSFKRHDTRSKHMPVWDGVMCGNLTCEVSPRVAKPTLREAIAAWSKRADVVRV